MPYVIRGRTRPWLFEVFPVLKNRLPWLQIVEAPTPVRRLERLSRVLGTEIWIKEDDKSSPIYGGNKPRKLEFLFADAQAEGKTTIVSGGGIGTNHGLATTIFGRELGFRVKLFLSEQPVTPYVRKNLRLLHAFGAEMHLVRSLEPLREDPATPDEYVIPLGGSSPVGTLGFLDAALELAFQVKKGALPTPGTIFTAAGTCGTAAGLALGLKAAGLPSKLVAVRVTPAGLASREIVETLAGATIRILREHGADMPDVSPTQDTFVIEENFYGPGYGAPTPEAIEAHRLLEETEGISLDPTYTDKTFAALLRAARDGIEGPVLFWNTFNSVDLSSEAEKVRAGDLPPEFRRFLDG